MNPRNAYYVLELPLEATPGEIERQGRKLLGLIELSAARGAAYVCPLGAQRRDATMVREAMAALRDPKRRARERFVASLLVADTIAPGGTAREEEREDLDDPVHDAMHIVYPGL